MAGRVKLNRSGVGAILRSAEMHRTVQDAVEKIAANVKALNIKVGDRDGGAHEYDLPVTTDVGTTDRAHGVVTLAHPAGEAVQAKHGALTKAAAAAGLEVRAGE